MTLRRFIVSSTNVRLVHNKDHSRIALTFCFHLKKLLLNHADYFEKLMMNMVQRKIRVNDGFGISKMVTSTQDKKEQGKWKTAKKFADVELQTLLDEDNSQT